MFIKKPLFVWAAASAALLTSVPRALAGEADINIPDLTLVQFPMLGGVHGTTLMYAGLVICVIAAFFGLWQYIQTKALPVHESMASVSETICIAASISRLSASSWSAGSGCG